MDRQELAQGARRKAHGTRRKAEWGTEQKHRRIQRSPERERTHLVELVFVPFAVRDIYVTEEALHVVCVRVESVQCYELRQVAVGSVAVQRQGRATVLGP